MPKKKTGDACKRLTATAYHEAGHAVAHYMFRQRFQYATIKPDAADRSLGHIAPLRWPAWLNPEVSPDSRARTFVEKHILGLFAGGAAAARWQGRYNWRGVAGDFHEAANLASYSAGRSGTREETEAYLRWLAIRARNLVSSPPWWCAVQAVAKALLERNRLSYTQVRRVIREDDEARFGKWPKRRGR